MSILYGKKINQLLANTAPTGLLFADRLNKEGYSGLSGKILGSFFSFIVFCIFAL
jgi:hypothetical protein